MVGNRAQRSLSLSLQARQMKFISTFLAGFPTMNFFNVLENQNGSKFEPDSTYFPI